jgi:hypothetical protein
MTSRTIEVIVSPKGETRIETRGFAGSSCQQASRFLEQALGTRAAEQLTAEFYQQAAASQPLQQKGGAT